MSWFLGILAVAIALAWWVAHRRMARHWRHLEHLLGQMAAGRKPENFVFLNGGSFSRLTPLLEGAAREQERQRRHIEQEGFNLRTILASMEEGVMVVDAHHVLRLVNPSFLRLFDLKNDPRGQSVLRALREPEFEEMVRAALSTGEAQTRDVSMNGVKPMRHFAVHAVPVHDHAGGQGVVSIFRDISRLKQLEDVRREFVANVSHELRTPLSIFHGYVENLADTPAMPRKEQGEVFEVLRKHSLRLNALLEDLLTLARLESRAESLQREEIALADFWHGVCGDWQAKMAEKKLTLTVEIAPGLPPLFADLRRLDQVCGNLLENAVKYTEHGGKLTIRVAAKGEEIELRFEDTGLGIPPTDLPHIFERFYRADKSRTREQGGTGLGLSIVKHIVQLHGGSVSAESKYGHGTAIVLRLPRYSDQTPHAEA